MNNVSTGTQSTYIKPGKGQIKADDRYTSKGDLIVMGVTTGLAATTIIEIGKGIVTTLAKHPLAMFSLGIASGYFAHKYRKQIISISNKTAGQSKDFVLRQKENIKDLLADALEDAEEKNASE